MGVEVMALRFEPPDRRLIGTVDADGERVEVVVLTGDVIKAGETDRGGEARIKTATNGNLQTLRAARQTRWRILDRARQDYALLSEPLGVSQIRRRWWWDSISPGGIIVYGDADAANRRQIYMVNGDVVDRIAITSDTGENIHPNISPDKTTIVFLSGAGQSVRRLRSFDRRTLQTIDLLVGGANEPMGTPAFAPDGARIAYAHGTQPTQGPTIWVMDADGRNKVQLTRETPDKAASPSWSPDGQKIVFHSMRAGDRGQIWVMNSDGSAQTRLTTATFDARLAAWIEQKVPAWSPNGGVIAYWRGVENNDPRSTGEVPREIWLMNPDGTNPRALTTSDDPVWSPDSEAILCPVNLPAQRNGLPIGIQVVDAVDGTRTTLFNVNRTFQRAGWVG